MHVTAKLRTLRERAGLTMTAMAKAMGLKGASSYQRYEDEALFKDEYLPLEKVTMLVPLFVAHGIPKEEVLSLAGIPVSQGLPAAREDAIPINQLRTIVQAMAEYRREAKLALSPDQEGEMVSAFCIWYNGEVASGRQAEPLTVEQAKSLLRLLDMRRLH